MLIGPVPKKFFMSVTGIGLQQQLQEQLGSIFTIENAEQFLHQPFYLPHHPFANC